MFLEAVGLIGAWVIRRSNRNPRQRLRSASNLVHGQQVTVSECQAAVKKLEAAMLEIVQKLLKLLVSAEDRELDRLVLADPLQREQRAKAALGAILRKQGCNPEQIEAVLNMLENQPE